MFPCVSWYSRGFWGFDSPGLWKSVLVPGEEGWPVTTDPEGSAFLPEIRRETKPPAWDVLYETLWILGYLLHQLVSLPDFWTINSTSMMLRNGSKSWMFFASGLHPFFRCLQPDGAQVTTQRRVLFAVPLLCHCKSQMSAPRQVQMDSIQETKVVVHSACCCCYDGCVPELNNIGCAAQEKGGKEWISEVRAGKNYITISHQPVGVLPSTINQPVGIFSSTNPWVSYSESFFFASSFVIFVLPCAILLYRILESGTNFEIRGNGVPLLRPLRGYLLVFGSWYLLQVRDTDVMLPLLRPPVHSYHDLLQGAITAP